MIEPTFKMIFTVSNKEKVQQAVTNNLRTLGVKPRLKRNITKTSEKDSVRNDKFKKVFNVLLSQQPTDPVKLSTGTLLHVPTFVRQAVQYLDNHLNQEGLFRKAGSNTRLKELVSRLDNGIELDDKSQPIDVANCLKKYFRDLPEPLIPYSYHDLFVRCGMLKIGKIDAILQACLLLPSQHLSTLAFVMDFLKKVSLHEKMNKMGIDNLAKVVGPNIMPLRETTMAAVQTRLDAHLTIIKILIENARNIGVVPKFILDTLTFDSNGNIENELDHSDSSFKQKKKKHRSGSLTRMFHGLKKIVGKNGSPECGTINRCSVDSQSSLVSPIKPNKKRKIIDTISHPHHQQHQQQQLMQLKKKRESYQGTSRVLFSSPVSDDPNPTQQRQQMKQEKHKKLGINLDRFVLKNRQKLADNERSSPIIERRWSMATGTSKNIKKRNIKKTSASSLLETKIYNKNNEFTMRPLNEDYNKMFTESEINLSDDTFDDCHNNLSILSKKNYNRRSINYNNLQQQQQQHPQYVNKRLSVSSPSLVIPTAPVSPSILSSSTTKFHEEDTDYVRIPKSEYEEIKNRVSAIETRIHEEFETIDDNNLYNIDLPSQVQIKYEKTLDKSNIETITPADQLAKRLSRDLKIRKSIENKIIRSPSARKIGVIRRRSQDKQQLSNRRKLNRSSSWHISDKSKIHDNNTIKHINNINNINNNNDCLYLNNETNAKLDYVHKKLCTLMNHTDEHTKSPTINYSSINNNIENTNNNNIKRSSSFHGNELIDNNKKIIFNNQMKNIKNTNSHRLILPINNNDNNNNINDDNSIVWSNASIYFDNNNNKQSSVKENFSPAVISQTGRASIAKLRTQNAGMVLAKARLFDDNDNNTVKIEKQKNNNLRDAKIVISSPTTNSSSSSSSSLSSRRRKSKSPKNIDLKYKLSPMKLSMIDQENSRRDNLLSVAPIGELSLFHDVDPTSLIKTPHIKKQLAIKTPKSVKSVVRRVPIDTRRTPLKAVAPPFVGTPKRQSPRNAFRSKIVARNII